MNSARVFRQKAIIRRATLLIVILLSLCLSCDQEPLHRNERHVLGRFKLQRWEDGSTFYLVDGHHDEGGGVLEGTVVNIGWNRRYILAERKANFAGDGNGWMIIDTSADRISGPFTWEQVKTHVEVRDVSPKRPSAAWQRPP